VLSLERALFANASIRIDVLPSTNESIFSLEYIFNTHALDCRGRFICCKAEFQQTGWGRWDQYHTPQYTHILSIRRANLPEAKR
jgi:hypothetical protein